MDAELRSILVEKEFEYGVWVLEEVDILTKDGLYTMWAHDEDLFGTEVYSRGTLEIFNHVLHKYDT